MTLGLQEVSHMVLVLLGAAQDQRRALFERSEFAQRPERTLAALKPLWRLLQPKRHGESDRLELSR